MAEEEFFSHRTAAALQGMWLPLEHERGLLLDVSVRKPRRAPRDARVRGHHLVDRPYLVRSRSGLRVSNALETWCQLASVLGETDLVVAGDSLLAKGRPRVDAMLERMVAAAQDDARPCSRRLQRAAQRIRRGSRSAWETRLRLLLVDGGLPEPEINVLVSRGAGAGDAEVDLVYREQRVLIEYEGDQHRTDRRQWRNDIHRYERFADLGWRVIRVTADDIVLRPAETVARVRAALTRAR
jgi:very-short-patch-repair endonuclease